MCTAMVWSFRRQLKEDMSNLETTKSLRASRASLNPSLVAGGTRLPPAAAADPEMLPAVVPPAPAGLSSLPGSRLKGAGSGGGGGGGGTASSSLHADSNGGCYVPDAGYPLNLTGGQKC